VVFVEINEETLRTSLAIFLDAKFGGSVFERDGGLELDFRIPTMPAAVQLRLAERLLWAWQLGQTLPAGTEVTLTASAVQEVDSDEPDHASLRLQLSP
jgi:hypothetical protein